MITDITPLAEIYRVCELNRAVRQLLEDNFATIWVEGEISNLKRPASGHLYFSLKDEYAQVRCAMFRLRNNQLGFIPKDGMHVLIRAKVSLYEDRGDYQLIAEYLEETGDGLLRRKFEELKQQLAAAGLFATDHKQIIPEFPQQIGVITSATGAALRDILQVLKRRCPNIPVMVYPTLVQGNDAALQIVKALKIANQRQECDVLIVARGGGSLEDLWPFNEEIVAQAIFASKIPIISGVGHEIDITIADFVADVRAPTPSAAAELVSPDRTTWLQKLAQFSLRLRQIILTELRHQKTFLEGLQKRLQHPGQRLLDQAQRLDYVERHLLQAQFNLLRDKQVEVSQLFAKLQRFEPSHQLNQLRQRQQNLVQRLQLVMLQQLKTQQQQFINLTRALDAVSPLNTLQRGYAIVKRRGKILQQISQVESGEKIEVRLADGEFSAIVE